MSRVRCRVLRTLAYADDHTSVITLPTGEYFDIDATCVPGLVGEGYVAVASAPLIAEDHAWADEQVEKLGLADEPEPEPKPKRRRKT